MALTFKLEDAQMRQFAEQLGVLATAINGLSENWANWQAQQAEATAKGFADLASVLGGDAGQDQQRLDALASQITLDATEQQDALDKFNQTKEK